MPDILFHPYDSSPFSEEGPRLPRHQAAGLGCGGSTREHAQAELAALTGGYRRIPVMQISTDIYYDSQLIVRELERRYREPSLFPQGARGLAYANALWSDRIVFQAAVAIIFARLGDKVPPAFIKDRTALAGRSFDPAAMQAAVPHIKKQMRSHSALLCDQLADQRRFLTGDIPGLADANAYYNLWFLRSAFPRRRAFIKLCRAWLRGSSG